MVLSSTWFGHYTLIRLFIANCLSRYSPLPSDYTRYSILVLCPIIHCPHSFKYQNMIPNSSYPYLTGILACPAFMYWGIFFFELLRIELLLNTDVYLYSVFWSYFRRPTNLSIVWTRRSRRVASAALPWEPDMVAPLSGSISWSVPDNHTISVTLFKDSRTHELEDKDWTFVIEDVSIEQPFCSVLFRSQLNIVINKESQLAT